VKGPERGPSALLFVLFRAVGEPRYLSTALKRQLRTIREEAIATSRIVRC